jgi:hypothetical protein
MALPQALLTGSTLSRPEDGHTVRVRAHGDCGSHG